MKDILILCADGLSGIKRGNHSSVSEDWISTLYRASGSVIPWNTCQTKIESPSVRILKQSIRHQRKKKALDALERVTEKWSEKYPNSMRSWKQNWNAISPIFKFSTEVRKVIYTTNAIESLNATYRKLNHQRSVFPSDTGATESVVPVYVWSRKEMDDTTQESGTGLWGNWASCTKGGCRNKPICLIFHRRMIRLFLSCNNSILLYRKQGLKAQQGIFSPVITIEDQHLQTFLHTLSYL